MEDLERAIEMNEQGLELTPLDHPDRGRYLNILGVSLQSLY
jgi:hypothetical protein